MLDCVFNVSYSIDPKQVFSGIPVLINMNQQTEIDTEAFTLYCYIWLFEERGPDFNGGGFGGYGFFYRYGGFLFLGVIKYVLNF